MTRISLLSLLLVGLAYAGGMPPAKAPSTGSIVFFEIGTADLARARSFYNELFGWKFADGIPNAALFETGGVPGMLNAVPDHKGGASTVVYVGVDHVRPTFEHALALGATSVIPPQVAPGRGSFAVFLDRDKNRIGIFSTEAKP
jgi:predicted enzyme related to lactoylglutathione lyase